jgi:sugar phosphate permease
MEIYKIIGIILLTIIIGYIVYYIINKNKSDSDI